MNNDNDTNNKIKQLNFEEFIWVIFIIISSLNIYGEELEKKYIISNREVYEKDANKIFKITLIVTFLIYIYFFKRNYNAFKNASDNEKQLYETKLLGSSFLLAGLLLLIYFQFNQSSFVGAPAE